MIVTAFVLSLSSTSLYERCKPFCIGVILGEVGAARVRLLVSVVLRSLGVLYQLVRTSPR